MPIDIPSAIIQQQEGASMQWHNEENDSLAWTKDGKAIAIYAYRWGSEPEQKVEWSVSVQHTYVAGGFSSREEAKRASVKTPDPKSGSFNKLHRH